jgi:ribosomal protein L16 Arg81 hydroxylase
MVSSYDGNSVSKAGLSFEKLIEPITKSVFFSEHYERKELVVKREDPSYFASLLSLDKIDEFITTSSPNSNQVGVVNAMAEITTSDYTTNNGQIDVARLYQLHDEGATIILPGLQRKIPELAALCRSVEHEFDAHFQTNIYLSPPNAQGFKTHYDTHDVFVLQIAGSKEWHSYDVPIELPLVGQKFSSERYTPIPALNEFRLNAGDLYYCPRGLVHDARSTDDISLHITFGLMAKTWSDLMIEAISAACVSQPAFRENLPAGFATQADFDRASTHAKFRSLITSFAQDVDIDALLDSFGSDFVASRQPILRGQMRQMMQSEMIDAHSKIMARPNLVYSLTSHDETVEVRSGLSLLTLPVHVALILDDMLSCTEWTDLSTFPGDLDHDGRVVLAKRLMREGLISVQHTQSNPS